MEVEEEMPIYEYQCSKCGLIFEQFIISTEKEHRQTCPNCTSPDTQRVFSPFSSGGGTQAGSPGGGCGPVPSGFS